MRHTNEGIGGVFRLYLALGEEYGFGNTSEYHKAVPRSAPFLPVMRIKVVEERVASIPESFYKTLADGM